MTVSSLMDSVGQAIFLFSAVERPSWVKTGCLGTAGVGPMLGLDRTLPLATQSSSLSP